MSENITAWIVICVVICVLAVSLSQCTIHDEDTNFQRDQMRQTERTLCIKEHGNWNHWFENCEFKPAQK